MSINFVSRHKINQWLFWLCVFSSRNTNWFQLQLLCVVLSYQFWGIFRTTGLIGKITGKIINDESSPFTESIGVGNSLYIKKKTSVKSLQAVRQRCVSRREVKIFLTCRSNKARLEVALKWTLCVTVHFSVFKHSWAEINYFTTGWDNVSMNILWCW